MDLDDVVRLGLLLSIWLIVFSLGARSSAATAVFLVRRPADLLRALTAMFVAVPAFAILLAATVPLAPPIKFAIVAMSVAPTAPIVPYKQVKAGADADYALGLMVAAALGSILLTPVLVALATYLLGAQAAVSMGAVTRPLLISIGLPLAAGMLLRAVAKPVAQAVCGLAQRVGSLVLLVVFAIMVAAAWRQILGLFGNGGVAAIAATIAVGLLAGHLLGGRRYRVALALAAATRHPGVAFAIAEMSYPEERKPIMAALLLFLLASLLVTAPYVRWARGRGG